jgi:TnpA family transposase
MMKYATAIRLGTASTEAILRRFNSDVTHPAYAAMLEVGRAQRTIFIARYLRERDLQREINAGLNVVENYNGSTTTSSSASPGSCPPTGARSRKSP